MHGVNGIFVIPALALAMLIVSFFTKVPGAIKWAAVVFLLVVVQTQLGFLGHDFPAGGAARAERPGAVRCRPLRRSSGTQRGSE